VENQTDPNFLAYADSEPNILPDLASDLALDYKILKNRYGIFISFSTNY
jgi:hypothetical protein